MKNKNKTFKVLTVFATALIVTPTAVMLGDNFTNSLNVTQSEDNLYTLFLDREHNPLPEHSMTSSSSFAVKTTLGNDINLHCGYLESYDSFESQNIWCILGANGYIRNTTPITGIKSVAVEYNKGTITLQYGDDNFAENETTLASGQTYEINSYASQFNLISNGLIEIDSITITYTCQPQ